VPSAPTSDERSSGRTWPLVAFLVAALWTLGFTSLHQYNVTWDEALGDLFFGQRYFSYFTSFDARYLDFAADPYPAGFVPDLSSSPLRRVPWEHYPVASTLGAASSALFARTLGWLDPFDGFHALNLLLGALFLAAFVPFVARAYGRAAALAAALLLFTAPRVAGDLMANLKDFSLLVFFSLSLLAFHRAWRRGSAAGVVGSGALWGLALGVKANALFLPAVVLLALVIAGPGEAWRERGRALAAAIAGAGAAGIAVFVACWPYLWTDFVARFGANLRYVALRRGITRPESLMDPLAAVLWTTPLPLLLLALAGMIAAWPRLRRRDSATVLLAAWILVVVVRLYLPGAVNFDGVRHFLELFPPLAALAGLGAVELATRVARFFRRPQAARSAAVVLVLLPLVAQGTTLVAAHPFESAWWNSLVGGLGGAQRRGLPQAGDYWGATYRLGLDWLNEHAPRGAVVAVPIAEHAVALVAPLRLRADLGLAHLASPIRPEIPSESLARLRELAARTPVLVMTVRRDDWTNALVEECRRLTPLVRWTLDGGEVLSIYRYLPPG
jgi:hypothetical protein